jgi:uncharacterized flavoprotein (TIGR03862 family)
VARRSNQSETAAVVGGGPAGLIAAEVLATAGLTVTVYDHMPSVGRKFLLAGRGGLNLTHSEPIERLLDRYGSARSQLASAIREFSPDDVREWCAGLGESTFIGTSGRVFPTSFRATPLLRAWLARLSALDVRFETRHRWVGWVDGEHETALRFKRPGQSTLTTTSDLVVFALGGASWPRVGSDGGWVAEFQRVGIAINVLRPANCGVSIDWSRSFLDRFEGLPLKNVSVTVGETTVRGEPVVTRTGLEGGPIYAHSAVIRETLDSHGLCALSIDLQPDLAIGRLTTLLGARRPKESESTWLKRATGLHPVGVALMREPTGGAIPSAPSEVARLIKAVPINVTATMPIDRAISSAGGVAFSEVDDAFMLRRRPGNFVAGEMLDWEAPTGGYLLQACLSTGFAAARGAIVATA